MVNLRNANFVDPPIGVKALAQIAGITGPISLRELISLLGDRRFGPSPFYILGHNTNSVEEVNSALDAGANAVEVDVTAYADDLNRLCIDHAGLSGNSPGHASAPAFDSFLLSLRFVADHRPQLALVVFDCKPPAATPGFGPIMINAIRSILTGGTELNIIISIADRSSNSYRPDGTSLFDLIRAGMGAREGFMIDAEDDPEGVAGFFKNLGVSRFCYGLGTSIPISDEGAMVYRIPIETACWMRVVRNGPRFVYAWTVNDADDQRLYLRLGVNGIISDLDSIAQCAGLLQAPEFAARYRLARRSDDPFLPANWAYGLTVHTSDLEMAGTDANVTFTVNGANGSASITVDTGYNGRMERGLVNFVVLPSRDLGSLQSVTVQRDNSGNAPDWHLASIIVQSLRYHSGQKTGVFNCWIDSTAPFIRPLT